MSTVIGRLPPPRLDGLVRDIQTAILSGDRERQSDLLLRSADALTRRWSRLPQADKPDFDRLLAGLLDQVDENARATFARHLAQLRRAPRLSATRLATDPSLTVAQPLLESCPSFDEAWLLALVAAVGEAHHRAVARRAAVSAPVCDALVRGGSASVAAALLANPGADVPPDLLKTLVPRAEDSGLIALALASRADLAASDRAVLVDLARRAAVASVVADQGCSPAAALALLDHVAAIFAAPVPPDRAACYAGAAVIAGRPGGFGQAPASTARLVQWIALRRLEDVAAVLARDAGLPVGVLIACIETAEPHGLAIVLRGLGHPWILLKALLRCPRAPEPTPEMLAVIHRLHAETGGATARRIARYAAVRMGLSAFAGVGDEEGSRGVSAVATMTPEKRQGRTERRVEEGRPGHA